MKRGKRILSLLLALVMSVGMFTGLATTAFAATEEMTLYMYDLPRGGANRTAWGHPALSLMGGWNSAGRDGYWSVFCKDSYSGQIVYCIEPGVHCATGDLNSAYGESFWDSYPSSLNPTISPTAIKAYIGRIMLYGWQGNGDTGRTDENELAAQIATQLLVWETVVGERDSRFNHVWGSSQGYNNVIEMIRDDHPLRSQIFSYYDQIESAVQQHTMLPSFFNRSSAAAGSYELKWNGTNYSVTLTDTNGVLDNFKFSSNISGIQFSVSGNQLTISCDTAPTGAVSITAEKTNATRRGVVVWGDGVTGGGTQDFATYGATVDDPVTGYMSLEVMTGSMKLVKTSEDGKVGDISFTISGEGVNTTRTTDANGVIEISDLNPGVYTVTEQAIDKYEPQETRRVTIVSGQTATVNFNNTLKRGDLAVTKTSEDGLNEGVTFHLYGISLSGLAVDEYAVTDSSGKAYFSDVLIGTGYTLEEVDTAIRYVVPDKQTAAVEWNTVTDKSFTNILKKFNVTLTKSDSETGLPQGDATLAGATYGLYKGDTLIDSYTTDANGQFTTGYYVCDSDWSIREINPSEGYLLDGTSYHVGAEPELYTADPGNLHGGIMLPLKNMINEAYSLDIGRKIKAQARQAMKDGDYIGARAPYGYRKDPENCHKLLIDEAAAPVVQQIFQWAYERVALNRIVRNLNEMGIPAPSHYKKTTGEITSPGLIGSGKWQTRTVMKILESEVYTGDLVQGKTKIVDHQQVQAGDDNLIVARHTHEPIISHAVFEAVQDYRKQVCEQSKAVPKKPYTPNIFKGKVFCADCGRSLHRQRAERKKGPDIYWFHCLTNSRVEKDSCKGVMIQETELIATVTSVLEKELTVALGMSLPLFQLEARQKQEKDKLRGQMSSKRQEIEKKRRLIRGLYENFVQGVLTSEEYFELKADYEESINTLSGEITELERDMDALDEQFVRYRTMEKDAKSLAKDHLLTAELIDRLIERIEIDHKRDIHVTFRFKSEFQGKEVESCANM